ncbi:MAG: GGDEF domain-containing protein [Deltaproteobacteria bacterium]|nr:GGDEF domain-containing protein [Deltaproteobacteria bacterium]
MRRGGDEFVLIMPGTTRYQAKSVAERIRRSMESEPIDLGEGRKASVTVSIGVAAWDGGESPEALEKRADAAMYQAKLHGRNRTYVDPS